MFYRSVLRPLAFQFPAEWVHHVAMGGLSMPWTTALLKSFACADAYQQQTEAFGIHFRNPIGLAAGFDKNGTALAAWENLGFGYAEIGTITPCPQPGNPKPRVFRYPAISGLINRLGFPGEGLENCVAHFRKLRSSGRWPKIPIGINIGKQKTTELADAAGDYVECLRGLHEFADYIAINVSSPNTPGLRELQQRKLLGSILSAVQNENQELAAPVPILLKISPDLSEAEISEILDCANEYKIAGVIATNSTVDHSPITEAHRETGGLSGKPLRKRSTAVIRFINKESNLPIIGVGGVFTADDAREKLDAGAMLLQLYTGFVYQGPFVVKQICEGLAQNEA